MSKAVLINLQRTSRRCEAESFFDRCRELNVEVVVLDGTNVDTRDVSGFVMVRTMETINKMESMMKAQSVKAGTQRRRAAGATAIGRCPFGYRYDGTNPVPHPERWEQAKQLWADLEAVEFAANKYVRTTNLPQPYKGMPTSGPGLYRWIKNKMLIGVVEYPGLPTRQTTPLVSQESWYRAQRLLERRQVKRTRSRGKLYLFTQLMTCKACDHLMTPTMQAGKVRMKHGHPGCQYWGQGLAEFKVKAQVIEALRDAALADVAAKPQQQDKVDPAKQLQLEKMLALQSEGIKGLEEPIAGLRRELEIESVQPSANWAGYRDLLARPGVLEMMPDEELRAVLLEFVDEILYIGNPDRVEIRLRDSSGTRSA